jgi:signal peptidase II
VRPLCGGGGGVIRAAARVGYGLALLVLAIDQAVKAWIIHGVQLQQRGSVELLPFISLTWVENRGVSMGLLQAGSTGERWLITALTIAIAAVVAVWISREHARAEGIALGLVLGGAVGNIVDRVRFGYVVDFVHLHVGGWSFYVFNVADAAISVGVAVLLARAVFAPRNEAAL